MKKFLAIVLTLVLMTGVITPLTVDATGPITFNVGSAEATPGERNVVIPIYVSGTNPGFSAVGFSVTFDTNELVLRRVDATANELPQNNPLLTPTQGTHLISLLNSDHPVREFTGIGPTAGLIVNLTFDVLANAPTGNSRISLAPSPNPRFGAPASESATRATNYVLEAEYIPGGVLIVPTTGNGGGGNQPQPSPPPPAPPAQAGHRNVVLSAGAGANWGANAPSNWVRHAPASGDITSIRREVAVNAAMPDFPTPTNAPSGQTLTGWNPARPATLPDGAPDNDWVSTAQWSGATASPSPSPSPSPGASPSPSPGASPSPSPGASPSPSPGAVTSPTPDNHPGLQRPPDGVTRPTGAGTITVIEHFGTWTGAGTSRARVDADQTNFQRLWYGNYVVSSAMLTVTSGSTVLTLSEGFITPFANGTYTFLAEFTGGHASPINLIVSRSFGNVPQTGVSDITVPLIAMSIALYLTLTAGVMLFFHIRQQKAKGKSIEKVQG